MKFYFAPMEGITGYVFRNAYQKYFGGIDTYFTPFIASTGLNHKEKNDVLPAHNEKVHVVPQILTNKAEDFLVIAGKMKDYGYESVNLNLGCPSGTVVSRHRGAGMLEDTEYLTQFLSEIFEKSPLPVSIKTRIGMRAVEEWEGLLNIFSRYPIKELIIHPRLQKEFYLGTPHWECYEKAREVLSCPLCYNGNIDSISAFLKFQEVFLEEQSLMIGRGLLKNPWLTQELSTQLLGGSDGTDACGGDIMREGFPETDIPEANHIQRSDAWKANVQKTVGQKADLPKWDTLQAFLQELLEQYCQIMSGEANTLFKLKEIWVYLGEYFLARNPAAEKLLKKIRKAKSVSEYNIAVAALFRECM